MVRKGGYFFFIVFFLLSTFNNALCSEDVEMKERSWSFKGIFGTYDRSSLRRGFQIYSEVCSGCHSMDYLHYRDLSAIGYTPDEIETIAAEFEIENIIDKNGDLSSRAATPADKFVDPYLSDELAIEANGALPPDLSLIVKARKGGANYLYALLTGYQKAPDGFKLTEGLYYNRAISGNQIAMPPPFSDDIVEYEDGTSATVDQLAKDMVVFLAWAAEPEMEERKKLGIRVIIFLSVLTILLAFIKRKVWEKLK